MSNLNIKPTHKPIKTYYAELEKYAQLGEVNEGTVRAAFQNLLQHYCHQSNFILLCEKTRAAADTTTQGSYRHIRPDGEVVDAFGLPHGYWEAKDTHDDLYTEASKKFAAGYPSKNIVCSPRPTLFSIRMGSYSWMWTSPIRETSSVCYRLSLRKYFVEQMSPLRGLALERPNSTEMSPLRG